MIDTSWSPAAYTASLEEMETLRWAGRVAEVTGLLVASQGPPAALGDFLEIDVEGGRKARAQVIGFRGNRILSMPLEEVGGLKPGALVVPRGGESKVPVGPGLLGRVLDGFGRPMDGGPPIEADAWYGLYDAPPGPMDREPIDEPLETGIRVLDSLLAIGKGQRVGIFGGSGTGKSTLLGCLTRYNSADVTVLALIGERNREVRDFIDRELGPEGLKKAVLVVSTSDRPAPLRVRACYVALAIAEYFRDRGKNVLLVTDSVTRLAMAQREIGLAGGEPPSQKGYTPSVFALLPRVFERAGRFRKGSITGFFTVLVEGDDLNEPIADAVRGILDGHIVLSRQLGSVGHYPAVDVLQSVSRLASRISSPAARAAAQSLRAALATLQSSEDLVRMGAYVNGSNARLDAALRLENDINAFLRQDAHERAGQEATFARLEKLGAQLGKE